MCKDRQLCVRDQYTIVDIEIENSNKLTILLIEHDISVVIYLNMLFYQDIRSHNTHIELALHDSV